MHSLHCSEALGDGRAWSSRPCLSRFLALKRMARLPKNAPERPFSTRFLPADGIPEYNALLDTQLGKRREFLLGNPQSLTLMQQTGVIARIETKAENPNQYVVHMAEKHFYGRKRLPSRPASGNNNMEEHDAKVSCQKPVLKAAGGNRLALLPSKKCRNLGAIPSPKGLEMGKSVPILATCTTKSNEDLLKKAGGSTVVKGTVEHLLESDAAFMTQIRSINDQLADLEGQKRFLDREIHRLRRTVRGVNAVRENDVAVAHCSSIMQHRIAKTEKEFMKLVTQQDQVKKDVDRVRHEVLTLRKVRRQLHEESANVAQANRVSDEKIQAFKSVRTQLADELSELERRAELALETQRLTLPPEDAVVVDVAKLMSAVKARNQGPRQQGKFGGRVPPRAVVGTGKKGTDRPKPLVAYTRAFQVLQTTFGFADFSTFEAHFTTTEDQLLAKYQDNVALAEEVATLEKEVAALRLEPTSAHVRGAGPATDKMERDMHSRVQKTLQSIQLYSHRRKQRNREHVKLRDVMLRALDAMHIDVRHATGAPVEGHPVASFKLLEVLHQHMTQLATARKEKHDRGNDGPCPSELGGGPHAPSGSVLSAILSTVQPPSVEHAVALTEKMRVVEGMHGLHRVVSPGRRRAPSLFLVAPMAEENDGQVD